MLGVGAGQSQARLAVGCRCVPSRFGFGDRNSILSLLFFALYPTLHSTLTKHKDRGRQTKKEGEILVFLLYFSLAFMRISIAVNKKAKPVMPLTSFADNGMPDWL